MKITENKRKNTYSNYKILGCTYFSLDIPGWLKYISYTYLTIEINAKTCMLRNTFTYRRTKIIFAFKAYKFEALRNNL